MASSFCAWRRLSSRRSRSSSVCLSIEMSVMQPSQPANVCGGVVQRRGVDQHVQLARPCSRWMSVSQPSTMRWRDMRSRKCARLPGSNSRSRKLTLASGMPWQASSFMTRGVGGLEHAVVVGREQRHRHVVEQILVAARGAHQVAVESVAFHRVRDDARQHAGVDAALLEIVLRAFAHRDQSLLVVVRTREHDDGRQVGDRAQARAALRRPVASGSPRSSSIRSYSTCLQALSRLRRPWSPRRR